MELWTRLWWTRSRHILHGPGYRVKLAPLCHIESCPERQGNSGEGEYDTVNHTQCRQIATSCLALGVHLLRFYVSRCVGHRSTCSAVVENVSTASAPAPELNPEPSVGSDC